MKLYQLDCSTLEQTQSIAQKFARAHERYRPEGAVWSIALMGPPEIGKSTFAQAFAKAVFEGDEIVGQMPRPEFKRIDMVSDRTLRQVRCGDAGSSAGLAYLFPRIRGYGGYDLLEHPFNMTDKIASVEFEREGRRRKMTLKIHDVIAADPVLTEALKKLNARELKF